VGNERNAIALAPCVELTETGLSLQPDATYEQWLQVGESLKRIDRACQWWIGDWLNAGEQRWGEMYAQAVDETDMAYETLRDYKWVANAIPLSFRNDKVPFTVCRHIAAMPADDRAVAIQRAADEGWTVQEARQNVRRLKLEAAESAKGRNTELAYSLTDTQQAVVCDAVITDPPYGILDEEWEPEDLEGFTREWASRWNSCGAHTFLIFWSQRHLLNGIEWFRQSLPDYEFTQLLIWHYPNNKKPQSCYMFKQTWEPVLYFRRKGSAAKIQADAGEWGDGLNNFDCHVAATPQSNFNDDGCKRHPAQKPVPVMRWLINAATQPGEHVCDPFTGSGTTGIAALQLGRRFTGIEINGEYAELARKRIETYGVRAA
jgi:DNA modification methylase